MKRLGMGSLVLVLGMFFLLGGCAKEASVSSDVNSRLDKLGKIIPVTRETGSGTRSSFGQALGIHVDGAEEKDYITESAQTEESTEKVIKAVGEEKSAIGYVTYGTKLPENGKVKEISVDGSYADDTSIENDGYLLDRTLYLAVRGDKDPLKEDFLTFVTGKGQEIIKNYFVPVNDPKEVFLSERPSGILRIHGSTSLAPVMEELASAYEKENPDADIEITVSDSAKGITDTLLDACDMAMVSRELYQYETSILTAVPVAKDGIRVIVNSENPLEDISGKMLKDIYTGNKTLWKETKE